MKEVEFFKMYLNAGQQPILSWLPRPILEEPIKTQWPECNMVSIFIIVF